MTPFTSLQNFFETLLTLLQDYTKTRLLQGQFKDDFRCDFNTNKHNCLYLLRLPQGDFYTISQILQGNFMAT